MLSMLRSTACHEHLGWCSLATVCRIPSEAHLETIDVPLSRINGASFAVTAARGDSPFRPHRVLIDRFLAQEQWLASRTRGYSRRFEERLFSIEPIYMN